MKFSALLIVILGTASAIKPGSRCDIEKKLNELWKYESFIDLPEDMLDMNEACTDVRKIEKIINDYVEDCTENHKEARNIRIVLGGFIKLGQKVCANDKTKAEFLEKIAFYGEKTYYVTRQNCCLPYRQTVVAASKTGDRNIMIKTVCW